MRAAHIWSAIVGPKVDDVGAGVPRALVEPQTGDEPVDVGEEPDAEFDCSHLSNRHTYSARSIPGNSNASGRRSAILNDKDTSWAGSYSSGSAATEPVSLETLHVLHP